MRLAPGQRLAHFRIKRKIGEGGMGAVFLAEDTKLDRQVALKVLPPEMAADSDRLERFQREAKAVAALNHPHIVTIHSVEEEGGIHFLTMELVDGKSLDQGLPSGGLPLAKVFDVGIALADALAAAHDKGIIHRDLKPANVMLTKDGRVKVLDFGLAKLSLRPSEGTPASGLPGASSAPTRAVPPDRPLTDAGLVVGTVPYMSPEQVKGQTVDTRTDIFSLGIVLYEMATGRRPFGGSTSAETISSILRDAQRPVTEARQDAPRHLERIVNHCLKKNPRERFQTARDVYNELSELRKEENLESSAAASAPASAAPEVSPVLASSAAPGSAPASTPSGATTGDGRSRAWIWAVGGVAVVVIAVAAFSLGTRTSEEPARSGTTNRNTDAGSPAAIAIPITTMNSIAVLSFADMSPGRDQEYFSDGLAEELINTLVKIPDLKVAGRTSAFSFKGRKEDLRSIGKKLGVATILDGSVRKAGDRIRVSVQLVEADDGFHLWSETYDRTLDDIFAVQDEIARSVAEALEVTLLGTGVTGKKPDVESYDLILQARFVLQVPTEDTLRQARKMLERALKLSPDYAPTWAEMGHLHLRENRRATTAEERQQTLERAREVLTRALDLDPDLAVAHSRLAWVQSDSWEFAAAERSTDRALTADPKNIVVMQNAASQYNMLGRVEEAITLGEHAREADPLYLPGFSNLARFYLIAGRLDEAEAIYREVLALLPDDGDAYRRLGEIHLLRGDSEEARSHFARFDELAGYGDFSRLWFKAMVEHTAGNAIASTAATEEFERKFGEDNRSLCAEIRAWRDETDMAFGWLDKALAARDPSLSVLKTDVFLTPLHADPSWNTLLEKIGLPTH